MQNALGHVRHSVESGTSHPALNFEATGAPLYPQYHPTQCFRLLKSTYSPYILRDAELEPYGIAEHIVTASSKLIAIDKLLADLLPKGECVLIFSQWTRMLDILEDFMVLRSIPYAHLNGSTPQPRRYLDIKLFQQEVSPYKVFLISTKAGGLSINLTKATNVIMCDSDWNPQNDLQAIARAITLVKLPLRIRQSAALILLPARSTASFAKEVSKIRYLTPSGTTPPSSELMDILCRGSSALSCSNNGTNLARLLEASMANVLEHSCSLEHKRDAKIKSDLKTEEGVEGEEQLVLDAEEEERRSLSRVAQVQSWLFEGRVVGKHQSNTDIVKEWRNLGKRTQDDRTVKIGGMTFIISSSVEMVAPAAAKPVKKEHRKFKSEEWCIHCSDGGELTLCPRCPRVFHASCQGFPKPNSAVLKCRAVNTTVLDLMGL
ncbi:hypothetical protein DXG01_015678 [Tephrocybe rancida]|nr:hypothetical protein DXG01_015678 [Tephrocybe rancida]